MASNRIEVDLKLLQDKNAQKLLEFGKQFNKSVDSLGKMLRDYAAQIQGASQAAGSPPGVGPDASRADTVKITGGQARVTGSTLGSGPPIIGWENGWPLFGQPEGFANAPASAFRGGPSEPPLPPVQSPPAGESSGGGGQRKSQSQPSENAFEREYVRAQRRIGEGVPRSLRQFLGYMAEGQMGWQNPIYKTPDGGQTQIPGEAATDDNGNPIQDTDEKGRPLYSGGGAIASKANDILFTMESTSALVHNLNSQFSSLRQNLVGTAMTGVNLGYSRAGWFGTPLGSPAWDAAMGNSFRAMQAADFGFSLNYSPQQAQQALQAIQNAGWSGANTTSWMLNFLKHQQNQGITPETTMAFLDPYLRFGGAESLTQLHDLLNSIGPAAKAANMNLAEFQQQLVSTAEGINQQTGMGVGQAASALTAFSSVTGMAPEKAAGLFENPKNLMMASVLSGQDMTTMMMTGHNQMAGLMQFGEMQFQRVTGGLTPDQIQQGLRAPVGSPAYQAAHNAMNAAWMIYTQNPQAFGGFSPMQWLNMGERAGSFQSVLTRISTMQKVNALDVSKLVGTGGATFRNLIEQYAGPNKKYASSLERRMSEDFQKWMEGGAKDKSGHSWLGNTAQDLEKQREWKKTWLMTHLNNENQKHARQAEAKMTIGLTREAAKWFKIMNTEYGKGQKSGGGGSVGSTIDHYAREAMHYASDATTILRFVP